MTYDPENIFAKILRDEIPSVRVYEDAETLAFLDIMPRADGHTLVIPKAPVRTVLDAPADVLAACMASVGTVGRALMAAFDADGMTLQQFNEAAGGQEVFHLHFHLLPRHDGLGLRAPRGPVADAAVLSEHAAKIRAALS